MKLALQAVSSDYELLRMTPEDQSLMIGAYRNAANFQTGRGRVWSIVLNRNFAGPGRVVLQARSNFSMKDMPSDLRLFFSEGIIRESLGRLTIDCRSAMLWDESLLHLPEAEKFSLGLQLALERILFFCRPGEIAFFRLLWHGVRTQEPLDDLIYAKLAKHILCFLSLLSSADYNNCELPQILRKIVGLGYGLTPSGDDFLLGFLNASNLLRLFEGNIPLVNEFCVAVSQILPEIISQTSSLSGCFLNYACSGRFSQEIFEVFKYIKYAQRQELFAVMDVFAAYGHTSGREILFGLLIGLSFWLRYKKNLSGQLRGITI